MGNRLSKIATRTGDDGTTGLGDGSRVPKDSLRIEAIGAVDELNSDLGVVLAHNLPDNVGAPLQMVQNDLFDLGGELSVPGRDVVTEAYIARLETTLESLNADLPPLKEFILPGGGPAAAACHVARASCRRAERRIIALRREADVPAPVIAYLNRLSDLLFVAARILARREGGEVLWQPGKGSGG